jgi:hypothetical protein
LITQLWSEWRRLLQRGGAAGSGPHLAGCTFSPRSFLLGSRSGSLPADLVARTSIMLALWVPKTFLLRRRPGGVCAEPVALASTSLALGALRRFRQGE